MIFFFLDIEVTIYDRATDITMYVYRHIPTDRPWNKSYETRQYSIDWVFMFTGEASKLSPKETNQKLAMSLAVQKQTVTDVASLRTPF